MLVVVLVMVSATICVLGIGGWLISQLVSQNNEIGHRLTDLEYPDRTEARASAEDTYAARRATGHRPSTVLNDFELPTLAGGTTTLSQWRGQRIALIFIHPDCPFSGELVPRILDVSVAPTPDGRIPVFVSSGDPARTRDLLGDAPDYPHIAIQEETEVARLLRVAVTPAAYLVDASSVTDGPLLTGSQAILDGLGIAEGSDTGQDVTPLPAERPDRRVRLEPGQPVPLLTMATLDDQQIVLGDRLPRRTALIFVDPDCPICRDLAPRLTTWTKEATDTLNIIVVSAADATATQSFVDEFALPFPTVPNNSRTVSTGFGALDSPSAALLDLDRRLERPIAVGSDAIISLLNGDNSPAPERRKRSAKQDATDEPLVSVILTTRDRPNFLKFALTSYQQQTYENRELIVVDDGDRFPVSPEQVEAAGGRLVRAPLGAPIGTKLNLGLEVATGTLCQKMDDDDWYAPTYIESMVNKMQEGWSDACRPTVAFVTPFLFFDVARWEIRRSLDRNVPGATLFFRHSDWALHRFRALPGDEDLWFFLDQVRAGSVPVVLEKPELFLAVRHRGSRSERQHTWINQSDNRPLEDYLLERPLHVHTPEQMLPPWALMFYQGLRAEILAAQESADLAADAAAS